MMHTMQIIVKQDMQFVMQCNQIVNKNVNKVVSKLYVIQ